MVERGAQVLKHGDACASRSSSCRWAVCNPGNHACDAGGLVAAELRVLEVNAVHDLGDRPQCGIIQPGSSSTMLPGAV